MGRMEEILGKTVLSESDVKLLKRRINDGKITNEEIFKGYEKVYRIDAAMTQKGYNWLMDLWKTPRGVERKNNPFGYREQDALEHFSHFELTEFFDAANAYANEQGIHFYIPLWSVRATDGGGFQYYGGPGEIKIIG